MVNITEGKAIVSVTTGKISRKLPVFYNPDMKLNRDISVLLLKALDRKKLKIADPLAASGIRSIRILKELPASAISKIYINDVSPRAVINIKKNLKQNKISRKVKVTRQDANIFLLQNAHFDYIDIDPFGTPVPFMDAAVKSISKNGILAITATDTAALAGTAVAACKRKYWAMPLRNHLMHEIGLRILIRWAQLIGASQEKALIPVLSYVKLHYVRVFFKVSNSMIDVNKILTQHSYVQYDGNLSITSSPVKNKPYAGPLWTGQLADSKLVAKIEKFNTDDNNSKFLTTLKDESKINSLGFYDTHVFSKKSKRKIVPKIDNFIKKLNKSGYNASRTHFSGNGVRTDAPIANLGKLFIQL